MKKRIFVYILISSLLISAALFFTDRTQALPEYSSQTGEPCASCHVSPSGGGARSPRGQAWVGGGRPSTVPSLVESLELLGVHLTVDESLYLKTPGDVSPAAPLFTGAFPADEVHDWVENYDGN